MFFTSSESKLILHQEEECLLYPALIAYRQFMGPTWFVLTKDSFKSNYHLGYLKFGTFWGWLLLLCLKTVKKHESAFFKCCFEHQWMNEWMTSIPIWQTEKQFYLYSLFSSFTLIQLTGTKISWWLFSSWGPMMLEATALPTEPQSIVYNHRNLMK